MATVSAREAAPFMGNDTPVVAIGGFSGLDPVFTETSFREFAKERGVQYFLMPAINTHAGRIAAPFRSRVNTLPEARSLGLPGQAGLGGNLSRALTAQTAILDYVRKEWSDVSLEAQLPAGTLFEFHAGVA